MDLRGFVGLLRFGAYTSGEHLTIRYLAGMAAVDSGCRFACSFGEYMKMVYKLRTPGLWIMGLEMYSGGVKD